MKSRIIKRSAAAVSAAVMISTLAVSLPASAEGLSDADKAFMEAMGAGWNLGNSLDAYGRKDLSAEIGWGNPKTTKEMIEAVHDAGFETIRIPVSWHDHVSGDDYTVDGEWMARVKEVVDYAYDDGMHVVINIHHDNILNPTQTPSATNPGYYPSSAKKAESEKFITSVWAQIAEEFKDYDEKLVFETLNEPRLAGTNYEWWFDSNNPPADCADAIETINGFNQSAVDVIRKSGGNNASRYIICPGYGAGETGCNAKGFKLPDDPANKIILSVHGYIPQDLCLGSNTDITSAKATQFSDNYKKQVEDFYSRLNSNFISKGIPVFVGETGVSNKNNNSARTEWAKATYENAEKYGIVNVLWDNNAKNGENKSENHWHFDRKTLKWGDPDVINAIMDAVGVTDRSIPADDDVVEQKEQKLSGTDSYSKTFRDADFTLDVKNETNGGGALSYSTDNSKVVTVDKSGKVSITGAGEATITVTAAETTAYKTTQFKVKVKVSPLNITPAISAIADQTYTGKAIEPKVTVKYGNITLSSSNYDVEFSNNTNKGTANVKVTLKNNYTGSATATFKIVDGGSVQLPADVNITKVSTSKDAVRLTWEKADNAAGYRIYRYNPSTKKFEKVKTVSANTLTCRESGLKAGTVYKYRVKAYNKNGGTTNWGNATQVSALTKPADVKIQKANKSATSVRLFLNDVERSGYKVQMYNESAKKWETVKLVKSGTQAKITGLKKNTAYKFRVQAYKKSGTLASYGKWTGSYKVTTKK